MSQAFTVFMNILLKFLKNAVYWKLHKRKWDVRRLTINAESIVTRKCLTYCGGILEKQPITQSLSLSDDEEEEASFSFFFPFVGRILQMTKKRLFILFWFWKFFLLGCSNNINIVYSKMSFKFRCRRWCGRWLLWWRWWRYVLISTGCRFRGLCWCRLGCTILLFYPIEVIQDSFLVITSVFHIFVSSFLILIIYISILPIPIYTSSFLSFCNIDSQGQVNEESTKVSGLLEMGGWGDASSVWFGLKMENRPTK